jgi:hypothetical protein
LVLALRLEKSAGRRFFKVHYRYCRAAASLLQEMPAELSQDRTYHFLCKLSKSWEGWPRASAGNSQKQAGALTSLIQFTTYFMQMDLFFGPGDRCTWNLWRFAPGAENS